MNIDSIINGVVIDHISAGKAMKLYELLGLEKLDCSVAIIKNVHSNRMGKKDIIKIDQLIDLDFDVLGYVDPNITVNIVKDGKMVDKKHMALPERLTNVIQCKNPRCITSIERGVPQRFRLANPERRVYRCEYCDTEHVAKR